METRTGELAARLCEGPPLLMDGATGTELEHRGARTTLPLWSAHALLDDPELVRAIHADYRAAGAELLTANTFRTQRRSLARGGAEDRAAELTSLAVELARSATGHPTDAFMAAFVVGSAPTLEDCYRPDLAPADADLAREHAEHATNLADAGVDGILVETMNTVREARAAVRAARATGLPTLVSFVCWEGATLLSGESLAEAVAATAPHDPAGVLVNCLPPSNVAACLPVLRASGLPFGVYANLGAPDDTMEFRRSEDCSAAEFAGYAAGWIAAGARVVGGCCGTTPEHMRAVAQLLRNAP